MRFSINSLRNDIQQIRLESKSSVALISGGSGTCSIRGNSLQHIIREIIRKHNDLINR